MRLAARCYHPEMEVAVVSRQSVVSVRLAGLERAQRCAGESFGHEELALLPSAGSRQPLQSRLFWAFAAVSAVLALAIIVPH